MNDQRKTKAQLIYELEALRQRVAILEKQALADQPSSSPDGIVHSHNTSKRKQTALRESEERFQAVIASMDDIIFTLDTEQRHTGVYGDWLERAGLTPAFFLGKTAREIFGVEAALIHETHNSCALTGERVIYEWSVPMNGQAHHYQTAVSPLRGKDGVPYGLVGVGRDITELKAAEAALRESESKLRTLFELLPVGVSILNSEHQVVEINASLEQILGIDRAGLLRGDYTNRRYLRADGTTMPPAEFASMRAQAEKHSIFNVETGVEKEDGHIIWTEVSAAPLPDGRTVIVTTDITERKQAEEALRQSEQRYQAMFAHSMDGVLLTNPTGEILYANPAICDLLGYTEAELQAVGRMQVVDPNDSRLGALLVQREHDGQVQGELTLVRKDGTKFEVELSSAIFTGPSGQVKTSMFIRDVTERKQAEEALRRNEARFANVITSAMDAIISVDEDQKIILFNPAAQTMFGYQAKEVIGIPLDILIPERFRKHHRNLIDAFAETKVTSRSMGKLEPVSGLRQNGEEFPIEASISQYERHGQQFYTVILRDIAGRKRAEEALRQSESRLRLATTAGNVGVWEWDSVQDKLIWDDNMHTIHGVSKGDFGGTYDAWIQILHPDDREEVEEDVQTLLRQNKPKNNAEFRIVRPDGEVRIIQSDYQIIYDENGSALTIIGTNLDITERKRAEAEEKARTVQRVEEQRLQSLGLLAGGVAHDINNLLTPIWVNVELLQMIDTPSAKAQQLLDVIDNTTQKIRDIVHQMLVYAGRGRPTLKEMDFNQLIRDIYMLLKVSLSKNTIIHLNLFPAPLLIQGDQSQLEQVLMNLIINASEAFEGQVGYVFLKTRRQLATDLTGGDMMVLTVHDTGSGIAPDYLNQIFDPFFTTKATGRGLGLSATRGIIQAHQGHLDVASAVGEGTIFTIRLPLIASGTNSTTTPDPTTSSVATWQGIWVMIDDEEIVRQATGASLELLGLQILEAPNGMLGLKLIHEHATELTGVLLDLTMPGMSGHEVFQQIREVYPTLPVVLISGYSDQAVQDLLTQPKVAFVAKPFRMRILQQVMRALVE